MKPPQAAPGPALLLALLAPALVLLVPPESTPTGRLVLGLFAAGAVLLPGMRPPGRAAGADLPIASWILLPLAFASVVAAPARARAVDEAVLLAALLLAAVIGRRAAAEETGPRRLTVLLAGLGGAVSLVALQQAFWIYPHAASELRAGGGAPDALTDAMLVRLEAGRPSGPFVLPTALAGFLAMTIAATAVVARRGAGARALALLSLGLQIGALLLTRSIGGLAAATAAGALLLGGVAGRRKRRSLAALGVASVLVAAGFLVTRRAEIAGAAGRDPLTLRAGNWRAAASIALDHPLFGAGPGDFATAYTGKIREGMNETRYAHNSWLQIVACWGLWSALPLLAGAAAFARRAGGSGGASRPDRPERRALAAGGAAFLLHNLVDFTLYLPAVSITGAILVGSVFAPDGAAAPGAGAPPPRSGAWRRGWIAGVAVLLAVAFAFHGARATRAAAALARARAAVIDDRIDRALAEGRRAAAARPEDPDPHAFLSELILARRPDDPALAREGVAAAERAARLDPRSAVRHATRAAWHAAAGESGAAAVEMEKARALYPGKPQYRVREGAR